MATYPIKMLRDEQGQPFVPLISLDSVQDADGKNINDLLENKIEVTDIKAGNQIEIETDGNTITINNSAEGMKLINNIDTVAAGEGALDAAQGKVLKDSIPEVVNNLTTIDSKKALSAHQGYVLAGRVAPVGGATGQVLKKASDNDYSFEWGDAADPNAIVGDGSIMKIVELSYEEYLELEKNNQLQDDTEYHINNWNENERTYLTEQDIEWMIYDITANHTTETQVNSMIEYAVQDFVTREETQDMINSRIIYDKTLTANATTVTIDGLDLEGDGGVYQIHLITRGTTTNVNSIYMQANTFQQGYWCAYWRGWSNPGINTEGGATAQSQSWVIPDAPYWQFGEVISSSFGYTDIMVMKAPDGIKFNGTHSLVCQEVDYCGSYSCNLYSTTENLTKITIFPSSGYLTPGTRIIISKL
jgi:hypothetical protein